MRNWCCRMHLDNRESPLDLLDGWRPCLRKQKDTGLAREGLMIKSGGVGGGGLGHPACLIATLFAILCVANLKNGSLKSLSTKSRIWSRRWRRCWGSSTGTPWWRPASAWGPRSRLLLMLTAVLINTVKWFSICTSANLLLLQSNRMIFSCAVSFESKKKKIPDLSLPPCINFVPYKFCYI